MFKIGEFSRLANLSIRMLRHYDKLGLLTPEVVDQWSGFRYYAASQLQTVNRIQQLKALGFGLSLIKEILDQPETNHLELMLAWRKQELEEELERLNQQAGLLDSVSEIMKEDQSVMNYHVQLKEMPERQIMSLRRVIPSYQDEGQLWQELYAEFERQKVQMSNSPLGVTVFRDEEYKEADVDIEVQSSIVGSYQDTESVKFYIAPAVQAASVTFHGSYEQMNSVMQALAQWIEVSGYEICGPMFNIMHVSPAQDPNPENWVTEACLEVRKRQD